MSNSLGRMVQWHDGRFGFEASPFRKELIAADTGSIPVVTPSFAFSTGEVDFYALGDYEC